MKPKRIGIVTIVSGKRYHEIWERTRPYFEAYADKCGADLLVLENIPPDLPSPHWAKFSIGELLHKKYQRIAYIDADILIRPDAPSIFDIVPEDQFGIFDEGAFAPRSIAIYELMKVYKVNLPKWDGKTYYNTGVMVASRAHRHIFRVEEEIKPLRNSYGEQTYLNLKILNSGVKVFNLPYKFNRMSLMDSPTGMSRLDSYFVHYAGDGDKLFAKLDRDIKRWAEDGPAYKYRQKIFIWALGGLGDCICAEPTVRYIRETLYPDADIYLMSLFHHVYHHIPGIEFYMQGDYPKIEIDAVAEMTTHPTRFDKFTDFKVSYSNHIPHMLCHAVDWVSFNTCNRMLPLDDRQIRLAYSDDDLAAVYEVYPDPEKLVLVHPGRGWETKTFPAEWWQKIIDDLNGRGIKVGIIGKNVMEGHGYVPVTCPDGCVDFRDKLNVKQLIALISQAPVLITNDSAPLHIAGAFENHIILIPTCKHGDLLMPYRNGQQFWRAASLYKKHIHDDIPVRATDINGWQTAHLPKGHSIEEYIPDADDVIAKAVQFYALSTEVARAQKQFEEEKNHGSTVWN